MQEISPQIQLRDLLMGTVLTRALIVAAELGIADVLAESSMDSSALAKRLDVNEDALSRLLRALTRCGVFVEKDGRFANSAMSECLRSGAMSGLALAYGDAAVWRAWEGLLTSVKRGGSAFEHTHGVPLFDYLRVHPDTAARFDAAMASSSGIVNAALAKAYDWSQHEKLVDVGGGTGTTLATILAQAARTKGVVFDLPHAVARAAKTIAAQHLAPRCVSVAGDFFEVIPAGADAYLLKHILHDWDDAACVRILRNCYRAMAPHGRLLVCERILGGDLEDRYATLTDLIMLALTKNGRERTREQYDVLLRAGGFAIAHVLPVDSEFSLIEATKIASVEA